MRSVFLFIEALISGMLPLVFLIFVGVYFTFKTRGFQFRKLFPAIKFSLFSGEKSEKGISSLGAMCNSLAATVGTGNIAGVAAAISIGGAGAVFWMWISALISMVLKASEIVIALFYRKKEGDDFFGGPIYYIKYGLQKKYWFLAVVFAFSGVFSAFAMGNITQVNSAVLLVSPNIKIRLLIGAILCFAVGFVIIGGAKKITNFTTLLLPLMAGLYILLCLAVIFKNYKNLDNAVLNIFKGAFMPKSVTGGAVGSIYKTLITGAQKGIFSNEAGLGTAGMAHSKAENASLKTQGFFGLFEVFVDTILICTLTALTILSSGVIIDYNKVSSSELVASALSTVYGNISLPILTLMLLLFGVASVIGWASYGMDCIGFLFGKKGVKVFCFMYPLFCVVGAVLKVEFAWRISEFFNGMMLITNLFALFLLSQKAIKVLGE